MKKTLTVFALVFSFLSYGCDKNPSKDGADNEKLNETVLAEFSMHSCLQNNMVLQREADFVLWGKAQEGVKVFVRPSWTDERYEGQAAADGIWEVKVPVPAAIEGNPAQTLKVYNSKSEYLLENLLIGDVWILGGQSNMGITLSGSENPAAEIASADQPLMRYYLVHQSGVNNPLFDWTSVTQGHSWVAVNKTNADWIGAIGYYFAKKIIAETGVPVGMINTCMGGASIKSYIPADVFDADQELVENFKNLTPGRLYNSMVYPVERFSCKGFLWYQGEADWMQWNHYAHAQLVLMDHWRENFNCPDDAPFYYVQLAPYGHSKGWDYPNVFYESSYIQNYALMREAQGSIRDLTVNTGMAVIMDVGDLEDIHPKKKAEVGDRLARIALNKDYGKTDVEYMGPVYKSKTLEGGVLKLKFDNAAGLKTKDGKAPVHFYVSTAAESVFSAAVAQINGEEIWLTSELISAAESADALHVRYAFLYAAETNLENGAGLPAEPFRTDRWDNNESVKYIY